MEPVEETQTVETMELTAEDAQSRVDVEAELETARQKAVALAKQLDAECSAVVARATEKMDEALRDCTRRIDDIHAEAMRDLSALTSRTDDLKAKIANLRMGV